MFFPKPKHLARPDTVVVPRWTFNELGPDERRALREIAATGDIHAGLDATPKERLNDTVPPRTISAVYTQMAEVCRRTTPRQ